MNDALRDAGASDVLPQRPAQAAVVRLVGVARTFLQGRIELRVLRDVNLTAFAGELIALVGPSGSGKSTLLHIAGLLERPDAGEVYISGEACSPLNDDRRTATRRTKIGFVYQYHHLLPEFTAEENVVVPQMIAGTPRTESRSRARELLSTLGLADRLHHRPGQLSGGEQQRVAIARAIANRPRVVLADEPTGNLDPTTAEEVFDLFLELARRAGLTALIATHNPSLAGRMDRTVRLEDGHLVAV